MLLVCNGMSRSGSTIQYSMLRVSVEKFGLGEAHGFFNPSLKGKGFRDSQLLEWGNDDKYHVIKIHAVYPLFLEMSSQGTARICYISRDIRDVAASLKRTIGIQSSSALAKLEGLTDNHYRLKAHNQVLFQKYETVIKDQAAALRELTAFFDIRLSPEMENEVLKESSIERIREDSNRLKNKTGARIRKKLALKILPKIGLTIKTYEGNRLINPWTISDTAGTVGRWKNDLTDHEIKSINEKYRDWLLQEGYKVED